MTTLTTQREAKMAHYDHEEAILHLVNDPDDDDLFDNDGDFEIDDLDTLDDFGDDFDDDDY